MSSYKILIVENNPTDAKLVELEVLKFDSTSDIQVVDTLDNFKKLLSEFKPNIVLSDFDLGSFNAFDILSILNESQHKIPCVIVTGTVDDEEKVARLILKGAVGFIEKKNMKHLRDNLHRVLKELDHTFKSNFQIYEEKVRLIDKIRRAQERFSELAVKMPAMAAINVDFSEDMDYIIEDIERSYNQLSILRKDK